MKLSLLVFVAAVTAAIHLNAATIATDPSGLSNGINPLGVTIDEEVGNTSLSAFNAIADKVTFTFDTADGYAALGFANNTIQDVILSPGNAVFADGLTTTFDGPNRFGNFDGFGLDYVTSGTRAMSNVDNGTFVITFSDAVDGIAFTLNRIVQASTAVRLYDATSGGNQIGTTLSISSNDHAFFGYISGNSDIRRVELDLGGGSVGIDDFTVIVPEPASLALLAIGATLFIKRRRSA